MFALVSYISAIPQAQPPVRSFPCTNISGGKGTFYDPNVSAEADHIPGVNACLLPNPTDGLWAAAPVGCFGKLSNGTTDRTLCGTKIAVTWQGRNLTVPILDICMGCQENGMDFTFATANIFNPADLTITQREMDGAAWTTSA